MSKSKMKGHTYPDDCEFGGTSRTCWKCGGLNPEPISKKGPGSRPPKTSSEPSSAPSLTVAQAEAARDEGMARVDRKADDDWKEAVEHIVRDLAAGPAAFNGDEVRAIADSQGITVHDWRAVGPLFKRLAKAGTIVATGEYRKSPRQHMAVHVLWRGAGK